MENSSRRTPGVNAESTSGYFKNSKNSWKSPSVNSESETSRSLGNGARPRTWRSEVGRRFKNDRIKRGAKQGHFNRNRQFSHFSLYSLLEKPLEEVIQHLLANEHFFEYIGTKLSPNDIVLIVKLLSRSSECGFPNLRIKILQKSLSSGFVLNLQSYVSNLAVQSIEGEENSYYWKDPDSFWNNLMKLCDISLKEAPHFFIDNLLNIVKVFLMMIPLIETQHQVHISDGIKDNFKCILSRAEELIKVSPCKNRPFGKIGIIDESEEEPPEDFHEISIFPTTVELVREKKTFLRKNVVIGAYKDVNHYLDIQFRLLREDFVGPLRLGIQGHLSGKNQQDMQDIKIHSKVQFLNPVTVTEDYCVLLQFHFGGKLSDFEFEDSRRFMYGSLVCFTKDNFKSILFGRIVDRDRYLDDGQVVIGFNKIEQIEYNTDYIMVEYSIYFEPYYHVLKVFKQIQEVDFPMKNYIVDVDKTILNPNYGDPSVPYKIESDHQVPTCYLFHPELKPTFSDLNQSQNEAFVAALTRQLSIIQGPPGTGKTYVGLKVARTLLKNSDVWFKSSPMLVICFTNHALDQFLEGLIDTTDEIIRIGGQSKNEKLKRFNLKNQKRYTCSDAARSARDKVTKHLRNIEEITDTLNRIECNDSILSIRLLANVIPDFHQSWLRYGNDKEFLQWLLNDDSVDLQFQQFENSKIQDRSTSLDLHQLKNEIHFNTMRLNELQSHIEYDNELFFEYMTLTIRIGKLEAIYQFVKMKLASAPRKITEVPPVVDVARMRYIPPNERWNLYFYWINLYKQNFLLKYDKYNSDYRKAYEIYNELNELDDVETLKTMKVIGMTTTSAARLHSTLQLLNSPIVIVEEAAEVLEAHVVSALTKSCQQLILIGDHKQLRPNTANYTIEKDYKLGISLFERMVLNEVQCFTLDIQHRMRPEISSLIKPTIYPNLKDHESVMDRPLIKGVENCLYFIDHKFPEDSNSGKSKKNVHEAKFLIQLARYLILNGYNSRQITILAAYLGQMYEIQKLKRTTDLLINVRVSVLDNYQGEESDIILLSLVRNNNENKIGFLSIENRVCVALSRARNGLYIMGNMSLLCDKSKLWVKIKESLNDQDAIGPSLCLVCRNHGKITLVSTADDFSSVPEGGCDKVCDFYLACGHKCKMFCHVLDRDHENYVCTEKCNRLLCDSDPTHICRKFCGDECDLCDYPKTEILDCGHKAVMQCHMDPSDYECSTEVEVTLPCGHDARKPCYIKSNQYKCEVPCDARLDCGHACSLKCHIFKDPDHIKYKCPKPCDRFKDGCTNLENDVHKCSRLCHEKCDPCKIIVRKPRSVCPHYYDVPCSQNVDEIICEKPCKRMLGCGHKCKNTCKETCSICTLKVDKQIPDCKHILKMLCIVKADRRYCNKKCPRVKDCGHICGGICNVDCNSYECKEIVEVAIQAKCGHIVKKVPCFVETLYNTKGESSVEALESYCTEPCTAILNCSPEDEHLCTGSCGSCYQGRIHKRCAKKCSKILVCNHECNGFCREACKPCSRQCSFKCKHSVCKKRCGDLCTKCKEQCKRKCKHQTCSKKCGEVCNVPPCEWACEKILECGHPCIGFCNDPCPPLCRICNKAEVEELFFGTEDEEDARFVLLNDCGHVLESSGMKQWLEEKYDNITQIGFKLCPKCKTNIFTTERYSDYVKISVENISWAKKLEIGTTDKINEKRLELSSKIQDLLFPSSSSAHLGLQQSLTKKKNILLNRLQIVNKKNKRQLFNLIELNSIEIKYQLMKQVFDIMNFNDIQELTSSLAPTVENQVNLILDNLLREVDDITTTEIEDIQREIARLQRMIQVVPLLNRLTYQEENIVTKIMKINEKINVLAKYDESADNFVKQELNDLRKNLPLSDITEIEKQQIVKAMGLSKGHWYMCPNGHPYVITECGGAMEQSKCPACKHTIGGENHRLVATNRVATFMDGATHSAWSENNNMNNYEF